MVPLTDEQIDKAAIELLRLRGLLGASRTKPPSDKTSHYFQARVDVIKADAIFVALHNARSQP